MSNRSWLEPAKTGAIVTVITVLVWLYAEGQNVQTFRETVAMRFVAPAGEQLAIKPREPVQVRVTWRASSGEMSLLKQRLSKNKGRISIEVDEPGQPGPGGGVKQTVVMKDALENSSIADLGLNILSTQPRIKTLSVEPLVQRQAAVKVVTGETRARFAKPPTPSPRRVTVTLPRNLARRAKDAAVLARMNDIDFSGYEANNEQTIAAPLEVPPAMSSPWTRLSQDKVRVSFNIRKLTRSIRLPTVSVRINADPLTLQDFDITLEQSHMFLHDVQLTGPSDAINAIRNDQVKVWAELRPTRDQAERGVKSLTPVIVTPDGVTAEPPPPIPVTIQRK